MALLIVALVVAAFTIMMVASAVRVVRQSHVGMIERFGKYRRTCRRQSHIVVPLLDRMPVVVDMRETVQPFAPQPVITQDNVTIAIDTVVYFQVTDAFRATYEVANFLLAMEQLAQTTLRNLVGAMTLEEDAHQPRPDQQPAAHRAGRGDREVGVRVTRVELKSIDPPRSIQEASAADAGRPGEAGRNPPGRGREAVRDPARRGRAAGADPERRGRPAVGRAPRRGRPPRPRAACPGRGGGAPERLQHRLRDRHPAVGHAGLQVPGRPAGQAAGDANKLLLLPSGASDAMAAVAAWAPRSARAPRRTSRGPSSGGARAAGTAPASSRRPKSPRSDVRTGANRFVESPRPPAGCADQHAMEDRRSGRAAA